MARIPYLAGSNSLEIPGAFLGARLDRLLGPLSADGLAAIRRAYDSEATFRNHVGSDILFGEAARALTADVAKAGAPAYLYRFSVLSAAAPKMLTGAPHASDRQYVFKTLNASPWPTDARDAALAETISAYWIAFAKTGDPNGPGRPAWPRYDAAHDRLIDFTNDGPVAKVTPDAASLDAIAAARK
jgi:para-nitrobenzyl esterase